MPCSILVGSDSLTRNAPLILFRVGVCGRGRSVVRHPCRRNRPDWCDQGIQPWSRESQSPVSPACVSHPPCAFGHWSFLSENSNGLSLAPGNETADCTPPTGRRSILPRSSEGIGKALANCPHAGGAVGLERLFSTCRAWSSTVVSGGGSANTPTHRVHAPRRNTPTRGRPRSMEVECFRPDLRI